MKEEEEKYKYYNCSRLRRLAGKQADRLIDLLTDLNMRERSRITTTPQKRINNGINTIEEEEEEKNIIIYSFKCKENYKNYEEAMKFNKKKNNLKY